MAAELGVKRKQKQKRKANAAGADAPAVADAVAPEPEVVKKKAKRSATSEAQLAGEEQLEQQQQAASAAAGPRTSEGTAVTEPATHKKPRRRKKRDDVEPADATPEELARRAYQRERQELARRLQMAGRPYKRQKPQKAQSASQVQPAVQRSSAAGGRQPAAGGSKQPGSSQGANGKGSREAPWETGDRPDHPVAVIIVPIFWLKREHEMKDVLQAAETIRKILADSHVDVGVDSTTPMSPGQKYRYWEMQGVKVRLEVGPKEAEEGGCIFSVSSKPGEVATKVAMQVNKQLLDAVRKQLQLPAGNAAADAAVLRQHSGAAGGSAASGAGGRGGGSGTGQQLRIGRLSGSKGRDAGPAGKHTVFGGDDLDDDFEAPEPEPQPTAKAKKKRVAAPLDVSPLSRPSAVSRKAAKLVQF